MRWSQRPAAQAATAAASGCAIPPLDSLRSLGTSPSIGCRRESGVCRSGGELLDHLYPRLKTGAVKYGKPGSEGLRQRLEDCRPLASQGFRYCLLPIASACCLLPAPPFSVLFRPFRARRRGQPEPRAALAFAALWLACPGLQYSCPSGKGQAGGAEMLERGLRASRWASGVKRS
jgi:hypothetical protein